MSESQTSAGSTLARYPVSTGKEDYNSRDDGTNSDFVDHVLAIALFPA